jgi:hypothetical protein
MCAPAGTYYVVLANAFQSRCGSCQVNVTVNIVKCPKGHVTGGRDDTCNRCPKGLFSFDPRDVQCSICGANTICPGGATVWAIQGFWHSAPQSTQMHRYVAFALWFLVCPQWPTLSIGRLLLYSILSRASCSLCQTQAQHSPLVIMTQTETRM